MRNLIFLPFLILFIPSAEAFWVRKDYKEYLREIDNCTKKRSEISSKIRQLENLKSKYNPYDTGNPLEDTFNGKPYLSEGSRKIAKLENRLNYINIECSSLKKPPKYIWQFNEKR